jgi:hypothetical protein
VSRAAQPTRRALFAKGLIGGGLLLVAAAVPVATRGTKLVPRPRGKLELLDETEHAILAAIAARVVPGDDAPAAWPAAAHVDCAGRVDALLVRVHPDAGRDFKRLLRLFENGLTGLFVDGRPTPFTQLDSAAQDERLARWGRSRLGVFRSGYQAVVRLVNAAYHSAPETYALVGYPGPPEVPR